MEFSDIEDTPQSKVDNTLDAIEKLFSQFGPDDIYKEILIEELFKVLCKKNS